MTEVPQFDSLMNVAHQFGGWILHPDCQFQGVSIDSRTLEANNLFVAIKGEHHDGHQFVDQAVDNGASGLVVEQASADINLSQWVVDDTLKALGQLALLKRNQFSGELIAITGSSGKTSVKQMLWLIMNRVDSSGQLQSGIVTHANYNNEIGVPLTLLSLQEDMQFAIVEMGARHRGDIQKLCTLARPTVALVNNVGSAHVGVFGGYDEITKTKGEIYESEGLRVVIINKDDAQAPGYLQQTQALKQFTYSLHDESADLYVSNIELGLHSSRFNLHIGKLWWGNVSLKVAGLHNIANALAAASCAYATGIPGDQCVAGLADFEGVEGRLRFYYDRKEGYLVDDTYNANLDSARAALDVLKNFSGRKILVMGEMMDLGELAEVGHQTLLKQAMGMGVESVVVGDLWKHLEKQQLLTKQNCICFNSHVEVVGYLSSIFEQSEPAIILVKGSRYAYMEYVVQGLLDNQALRLQPIIEPVVTTGTLNTKPLNIQA